MSSPVWIVVANGSRARLFQRDNRTDPLFEVRDWVHPQTRQHARLQEGEHRTSGIDGRAGLATRLSGKDRERAQFAQEICQWLEQELATHRIHSLAILASNPFLGDLMSHGHRQLRQQLCASHAVDLTALPVGPLDQRLRHDYRL